MEVKATHELHPEWQGWSSKSTSKQDAMDIDARPGTHPVIMHIDDVSQTEGAFDTITYSKGSQVVRTLEAYMGDDAFRDGVRRYIARHAYGNTFTDDLWQSLDEHAARPVRAIARDLTLRPGVPMILEHGARCVGGRTEVMLSQDQFTIGGAHGGRWHAPVTVAVLGGGSARAVIEGPELQAVTVPGCGPVVVNAGQSSYLRVRYSEAGLATLTDKVAQLGVDDQLGLLADTQALALAGKLPMGALLGLMRQVPATSDPLVIQLLVDQLTDLDVLHDGLATQPAFRAFARSLLLPVFARVGWQPAAGEAGETATLRAELIEALGTFDDPAVVAETAARFKRFLGDAASLQGDVREAVLTVVAIRADAPAWDALHGLAQAAATPLEKAELYRLLGLARERALADRALALAVSGEPPVTVAGGLLRSVGTSHPGATLDFIATHWARVEPLFGEGAGATIAARFFNTGADRAMLPRLDAFVRAHVRAPTRERIVKVAARIQDRATVRAQRLPQADRWMAEHATPP
jgi:aminopeptidase N